MTHHLCITAGRGPWECRRFVALLVPAIAHILYEHGIIIHTRTVHGDPLSPGSADLQLADASLAHPVLPSLLGSHQLTATGPALGSRRTARGRKRWFVQVALQQRSQGHGPVHQDDLRITTMRASGPGGQNVNRRATAVRIHHLPTGLTTRIATERSQQANRRRALAQIDHLLMVRSRDEQQAEQGGAWQVHNAVNRGQPAVSWTLDRRGKLAKNIPSSFR